MKLECRNRHRLCCECVDLYQVPHLKISLVQCGTVGLPIFCGKCAFVQSGWGPELFWPSRKKTAHWYEKQRSVLGFLGRAAGAGVERAGRR